MFALLSLYIKLYINRNCKSNLYYIGRETTPALPRRCTTLCTTINLNTAQNATMTTIFHLCFVVIIPQTPRAHPTIYTLRTWSGLNNISFFFFCVFVRILIAYMQICKPSLEWGGNEEVVVLLFAFLIKNCSCFCFVCGIVRMWFFYLSRVQLLEYERHSDKF